MALSLDHIGLLYMWHFLGANHITSDIQLALQTHAAERQFLNWIFHVLLHDKLRVYFEPVDFYIAPAHPRLTGRLQGALDLLALRCVNLDMRAQCTNVVQTKGIVLHEFVRASSPVHLLDHNIFNVPHHLLGVSPGQCLWDVDSVFLRVRRSLEEQQDNCDDSLCLFEFMLEQVCSKNNAVRSKIYTYDASEQSPYS